MANSEKSSNVTTPDAPLHVPWGRGHARTIARERVDGRIRRAVVRTKRAEEAGDATLDRPLGDRERLTNPARMAAPRPHAAPGGHTAVLLPVDWRAGAGVAGATLDLSIPASRWGGGWQVPAVERWWHAS